MHKRQNSKRMIAKISDKTLRLGDPISEQAARETKERFVPQTQFGRRLWKIRKRILASGQRLLEWEQIEHDRLERRGEPGGELTR
jgi:hypothetical protein